MIKNISKYIRKTARLLIPAAFLLPMSMVSCQDFFDVDSTHIIDASDNHLSSAQDTMYSVTGILTKLQTIADRTVLLGEARGDLVDITSATSADLRKLALFQVNDSNQYNAPVDYYAIINNCNYFLANADTAFKDNRGNVVFMTEYTAVKAIRAWTYLQLVTTYGKVPFVTEPILSESMADVNLYPQKDIQGVCEYFLNEDSLLELINNYSVYTQSGSFAGESYNYPSYGTIKGINSKLLFFPLRLVYADLCLWAASMNGSKNDYRNAATYYYQYITERNGGNVAYPTGINDVRWADTKFLNIDSKHKNWSSIFSDYSNGTTSEIISIIPTDSLPSEGHYSQLRNIFNTYPNSDSYEASLVPSQAYKDLSAAQDYILYQGSKYFTAPKKGLLDDKMIGDLRFSQTYSTTQGTHDGSSYDRVYTCKMQPKKVNIYRRMLVYLRFAEAINRAGYPEYAFRLLSSGVTPALIRDSIASQYKTDSASIVDDFGFKGVNFNLNTQSREVNTDGNTQGIHSRGSGYTPANTNYGKTFKEATTLDEQIKAVEDMIVDEEGLEFAMEGYRYYDLLRVALRRTDDPNYLKNKISARGNSQPAVDLSDKTNWFLHYKNQIGY